MTIKTTKISHDALLPALEAVGETLKAYPSEMWMPILLNATANVYMAICRLTAAEGDTELLARLKHRFITDVKNLIRLAEDPEGTLHEAERFGYLLPPEQ